MKKILILGREDMLPVREFHTPNLSDYRCAHRDIVDSDVVALDFEEYYLIVKDRDSGTGRHIVKKNNATLSNPLELIE